MTSRLRLVARLDALERRLPTGAERDQEIATLLHAVAINIASHGLFLAAYFRRGGNEHFAALVEAFVDTVARPLHEMFGAYHNYAAGVRTWAEALAISRPSAESTARQEHDFAGRDWHCADRQDELRRLCAALEIAFAPEREQLAALGDAWMPERATIRELIAAHHAPQFDATNLRVTAWRGQQKLDVLEGEARYRECAAVCRACLDQLAATEPERR
jgi:hypothetical protein